MTSVDGLMGTKQVLRCYGTNLSPVACIVLQYRATQFTPQ
jgi:hypothetical protein